MKHTSGKNNNIFNSGVTLIELLLVIAIIGVISTYSVSFYSRFIQQNAVFNAADQLLGSMRRAQILAIMGRLNASWGVNITGTTLTLYAGNTFATRNSAYDEIFTINPNINQSGSLDVNFKRATGTPSATPSIIFSGLGSSKTINVNSQGVASIQ